MAAQPNRKAVSKDFRLDRPVGNLRPPDDLELRRLAAATRRDESRAAKDEADTALAEEQAAFVRLEAERLVGEIARQPEEKRALELANEEAEVKILCRLTALIVPLCLVAVTLVLAALGSDGRSDFPFEQWQWLIRLLAQP